MHKTASSRSKFELILVSSVVIILLLTGPFFTFTSTYGVSPAGATFNFTSANFADFENFARQNGAGYSYKLLKAKFQNNDVVAHNFAHVVGIVAYEQLGSEGMGLCDNTFSYGCYHGYIEAYLQKNGVEGMSGMEKGCTDLGQINAGPCLHGIGHGVMAISYVLGRALENCDRLSDYSKDSCYDGVFMERNTGSMLPVENRFVLSTNNLMEPCKDLASRYQPKCWRNQVFAWYNFFGGDLKKVEGECRQIDSAYQENCLRMLGMQVGIVSGNVAEAAFNCRKLSDDDAKGLCILGASDELMFENKDSVSIDKICNSISSAYLQKCKDNVDTLKGDLRARFNNSSIDR